MSLKRSSNLATARYSTGPQTEAGKAKSRYNATRHGLSGKQIVVYGEDPAELEVLRKDLLDSFELANAAEHILVEEIAQNFWRLQRARQIEAETFNINSGGADPVIASGSVSGRFDQVRRYMTTIERAYHRAIAQLESTQAIRRRQSAQAAGFVSQSSAVGVAGPPIAAPTKPNPALLRISGLRVIPGYRNLAMKAIRSVDRRHIISPE